MFDLDNWQEIWQTITRNKTRSFLTGFGVFWGLFMLILLMGFGNAFKSGVQGLIQGFSTNLVVFQTNTTSEPYKGFQKGRRWRMDVRDLTLIRERSDAVEYLSPMIFGPQSENNTARGTKSNSYPSEGVTPDFFSIQEMELLYGRLINQVDIDQRRKVCVIGEEVYETLFDIGENPLGEEVRLNGRYFQVVGVVRPYSSMSITNDPGVTLYLPFSTMQQLFTRDGSFQVIMSTTKPEYGATELVQQVTDILKTSHDIAPTDNKAVWTLNIEQMYRMIQALFSGIDILVLIVGLGALFSGIIGISNIMLVTVRERTREIGVRRALGAKPWNILLQIMNESILLTGIAGLSGFILATGILIAISQAMSMMPTDTSESFPFGPPLISFNLALGAMAILIVSGAIAGLMPALKALQIKAIDAIRDE
jgi:putative ABC transport system permease protein